MSSTPRRPPRRRGATRTRRACCSPQGGAAPQAPYCPTGRELDPGRRGLRGGPLADPRQPRRRRRGAGEQLVVVAAGRGELERVGPELGGDLRDALGERE